MAAGEPINIVSHQPGIANGTADGELLERFVSRRDEAAFEVLVQRHGPMVLAVCRHLLSDPHDADDAFQTTFLILVRKAGSIGRRELLGNWLYGVAYRVAVRARANAARRRAHEQPGVDQAAAKPVNQPAAGHELAPVLHEEVQRLPAKYRPSVVLCYLEGKTLDEAAEQLGCTRGAVKGRLERARDLLRQRLIRRGLAISVGLFALLASPGLVAAVPGRLVAATMQAAAAVVAGRALASVVSAQVAALTEEVLRAWPAASRVKTVAALVLTALLAPVAAGFLSGTPQQGGPGTRVARAAGEQTRASQPEPAECHDGPPAARRSP